METKKAKDFTEKVLKMFTIKAGTTLRVAGELEAIRAAVDGT